MYEVPPGDVVGPPSEFVDVLAVGVALYQWKARNEQEMSFARGDKIEVLEQGEMRWRGRLQKDKWLLIWIGEKSQIFIRKVEGWFPKSYVKLDNTVKEQEKQQPRETETKGAMDQTTKAQIGNDGGTEGEWYTVSKGNGKGTFESGNSQALYQFDAVEATDLSLKPGDRIWVIDQRDQWWRGTCEGRTGIFPANYVQKVKENGVTEQPQSGRSLDDSKSNHYIDSHYPISRKANDWKGNSCFRSHRIQSDIAEAWWCCENSPDNAGFDRKNNKI